MISPELPPRELEDLASEIGEFICYWGFKKIHGRIWTHIYLAQTPLDAGHLMRRLKVSKALISLSVNDLLRFNVIFESGKSPRGTQTYSANPDVLDVILTVIRQREGTMLAKTAEGHKLLKGLSRDQLVRADVRTERIESLGKMIADAQNGLRSILELATLDLTAWDDAIDGQITAESLDSETQK